MSGVPCLDGQTFVVTGASGFVGRALCSALSIRGARVLGLVRDPARCECLSGIERCEVRRFVLGEPLAPSVFETPIDGVVHCACAATRPSVGPALDVDGTRLLYTECKERGAGLFVFVSSFAAHKEARSGYGRSKWELERFLSAEPVAIVKPGTVIGDGGLFRRVCDMAAKMLIIPAIYPDRRLQTVYIDDLCEAISTILATRQNGVFEIAEPEGVSVREFYSKIAEFVGSNSAVIPFPGDLALAMVRAAEGIGVKLPVSSDNLLGLKYVTHFDTRATNERLGIAPRGFLSSLDAMRPGTTQ